VTSRCALAALLAAAVAAGAAPGVARADGDPAGTVLVSHRLFLPRDAGASAGQRAQLRNLVRSAGAAGFPIRVAVIARDYDLGSVTALWRRPRTYVRYLSAELAHIHGVPLLVVMPDGLGFSWQGHSPPGEYRLLSGIEVGPSGGLLAAAEDAVRTLATDNGITISVASRSGPATSSPGSGDAVLAIAAAVAAVLLAALAARPALAARIRRPRSLVPGRRWAVPGLAALGCAAAGVPIVAVGLLRHAPKASGSRLGGVGTPYTWRPGRRRAPGFRLTGEDGRPVSLAAYRGRPVIITFVDPMCRDLCPLAAHVLNQVDRELPASRRPVIIGVSVNVYGDSRADLRTDSRRWDLVPQWRWAVGPRRRLETVWRRYHVGVSVSTSTIAGTTVHSVSHDEVAFLVDRSGYVRALYGWPYYPENLETAVKRLGSS
jgi:cytochrome oxidase Cu insertion factor (SCO1/SenC/PrrC family)